MKNKELQLLLKKFDDDLEVRVNGQDDIWPVSPPELSKSYQNDEEYIYLNAEYY